MIAKYMHCAKCLRELPFNTSPGEFSNQECGVNENGEFELRCKRHDALIAILNEQTLSALGGMGCAHCGAEH